jgi:hypothetical protein
VGNVLAAEAISGNMIPNGQAAWDQRVEIFQRKYPRMGNLFFFYLQRKI